MKRGGFTLLEALITVLILGGLTGVVFMVFAVGASAFRVGNNRLDLQSDLRRVLTPLRRDLENTSFQSISATNSEIDTPQNPPAGSPTVLARRDGICMNALRDSLSDSSYAPGTGLPNWDGFLLYFATRDIPDGRMVRLVLKDPTPGGRPESGQSGRCQWRSSYPFRSDFGFPSNPRFIESVGAFEP